MQSLESVRPALYMVATPIGNLEDITMRALRILRQVDCILCEDTRKTGILLKHYEITSRLKSYRVHQEEPDIRFALNELELGHSLAFCSDAGTPGFSDPGSRLVRTVREKYPEIPILPVPGPSAFNAAVSVCGWKANPALFAGFLSIKPGKRKRFLETLQEFDGITVIYESVHRIEKVFREIVEILPDREIFLAREITKIYEEYTLFKPGLSGIDGTEITNIKQKGEFTIIIGPKP